MQQVFAHNRNEISAFAAELVFCEVPGEFLQWGWDGEGVGVGIGGGVALIDAVGGGVAGVSPPPVCLCFLAADGLAFGLAAGALAVADSWVRIEPPQTIPAGALPQSGHPLLSARLSGGQLFVGRGGQVFASAEGRYERKPLIVTTNRPFKEWNEVFPDATCIVTLLDRLLHHADVTVVEGTSLPGSGERAGNGGAKGREMNSEAAFAAAVLGAYANLPGTPLRPSPTDQAVARKLFRDAVPLPIIESALLLGSLRRLHRSQDLSPLPTIRSLAYFLPVIEELQLQPLPDGYLQHLRLKLDRLSASCSEKYVF